VCLKVKVTRERGGEDTPPDGCKDSIPNSSVKNEVDTVTGKSSRRVGRSMEGSFMPYGSL